MIGWIPHAQEIPSPCQVGDEVLIAEKDGRTENLFGYYFLSSAVGLYVTEVVTKRLLEANQAFGWLILTWKSSEIHPPVVFADLGAVQVEKNVASQIAELKAIAVADEASAKVEVESDSQASATVG